MNDTGKAYDSIVALRNEKGSYSIQCVSTSQTTIVALRNEKGSYSLVRYTVQK